ncbi:MAG: ankyrin repeat domain-containing protein [Bacteroidota bacterium]
MDNLISTMSRSQFIKAASVTATSLILPGIVPAQNQVQDKPAPIKLETVKEFVGVAHGKFDRVKEMLENDHLLLHVSYDWGGGDFESPIEAAGHVGNKEIANYLLSKGARYNIYLACMLGHLETVKQVLTFNPGLLNSKGPHGFTMLHHAQKGQASEVVSYLESLGAKETRVDFYARL